jgi:D-alanyl-D-alanine dipeptidase
LINPFGTVSNTKFDFILKGKPAKQQIPCNKFVPKKIVFSELEKVYKAYKLVNVQKLDPTIMVNLKYADTDNFLKTNMYGYIKNAYLQQDVAIKLAHASVLLKKTNPLYRLVVLDAARPLSIQQKMWVDINLPNGNKEKFVASPQIGSLHNFGAAVDISIANKDGKYLDMGTSFDSFSDTAYTVNEEYLLKTHKLNQRQYENRKLLRKIMVQAGFSTIETEWWHFNSCSRNYAKSHYPLIVSHLFNQNPLFAQKVVVNAPTLEKVENPTVSFKIQVMISQNKFSGKEAKFKNLTINFYVHDGFFKYTTGNFSSLEKALNMLDKVKSLGFKDAFIVAFNNNKRISIKDATELLHYKNNR